MGTVGFYLLDLWVTILITFGALGGLWALLALLGTLTKQLAAQSSKKDKPE